MSLSRLDWPIVANFGAVTNLSWYWEAAALLNCSFTASLCLMFSLFYRLLNHTHYTLFLKAVILLSTFDINVPWRVSDNVRVLSCLNSEMKIISSWAWPIYQSVNIINLHYLMTYILVSVYKLIITSTITTSAAW